MRAEVGQGGGGAAGGARHDVEAVVRTTFSWDYGVTAPELRRLAVKARGAQWDVDADLDWATPVDPEAVVLADSAARGGSLGASSAAWFAGTPVAAWGPREWLAFGVEAQRWMLSQFLHGEQGALVCTARIVESAPTVDAKLFAATQVLDEARHVEAFARYVDDKLGGAYPVNPHLRALLDDVVADSRWDVTYLGMQILVEGLALGAFGFMAHETTEPLLRTLLGRVMADEARHVAFGVLTLEEVYAQLGAAELRERQELALDASLRMRDRLLQQEVWEHLGVDHHVVEPLLRTDPARLRFQHQLFGRIVPACHRLGLLDANRGWLRERFVAEGLLAQAA